MNTNNQYTILAHHILRNLLDIELNQDILDSIAKMIKSLFDRDDLIDNTNQYPLNEIQSIIHHDDKRVKYFIENYIKSTINEKNIYENFTNYEDFFANKVDNSGIGIIVCMICIHINISIDYDVIDVYGIYISILNDIISYNKEFIEKNPFNLIHILIKNGIIKDNAIHIISTLLIYSINQIESFRNLSPRVCEVAEAVCNGYLGWALDSNRYQI